ncbi:TPA: GNAT family N-acetyltransferase [Serratia marcescens]|nr:GNAT family N-acetyltransferase [Serratia marcescens]HEJ6927161.1 GNAT family N-acetyltransferase [Serratia marcescens]HEJ7075810.1 GNAT family N-acetyltransferase [Serratia marcescens]HEJ7198733.1 GNAT family N-acetyltransferase [Serratia marcescens]
MSDAATNDITPFLSEIFENEATGILQDLMGTSALAPLMMFITEAQIKAAKGYIIGVLDECYQAGHLSVLGAGNVGELYGYALIFGHRAASPMLYCHKIYVYESYRGKGIGSQMLTSILNQPAKVGLICSPSLVPFYEAAGMHCKGDFTTPGDLGFKQTQGIYSGLCVMTDREDGDTGGLPIFMMNDDDVEQISKAIMNCNQ